MKLKNVKIQNFKCIIDSEEFSVPQLTCLVGKNESGKTALLQALYKIKPVETDKSKYDYLNEYPRQNLSDYESEKDENPANIIDSEWELEEKDIEFLNEYFGTNPISNKRICLKKGYDNKLIWSFEFDEKLIVACYISNIKKEIPDFENEGINEVVVLKSFLEPKQNEFPVIKDLLNELNLKFKKKSVQETISDKLSELLPSFLYFADYQKIKGTVSFQQLIKNKQANNHDFSEKIFLALLDLAETTPEDIDKTGTSDHLIARLEGIRNKLSKEIFAYWSQNENLRVDFRFETARPNDPAPFNSGYVFLTRIENMRHGVSVSFDERSSGFVWFFSFLVWFSQIRKIYGDNLILLLDEPALNLHAKAQYDLLRYINEKLTPNYQVIYTTHSPFMIDPDNLLSVRTVEDKIENKNIYGTKVGDKVFSIDKDTLFPLQAALGYDITQTLFIGKNVLLVEGPSDIIYLKWFSNELKQKKRNGLDSRWVITPCGGIDKVSSFVTLFSGNQLNIAVFTDYHSGDKRKIQSLLERNILKQAHIFTANMYVEKNEADIEDLIGDNNYIELINLCYNISTDLRFVLAQRINNIRIMQYIEDNFRTLPTDYPEFDHLFPALYLLENSSSVKNVITDLPDALNRFEKLFLDINKQLD